MARIRARVAQRASIGLIGGLLAGGCTSTIKFHGSTEVEPGGRVTRQTEFLASSGVTGDELRRQYSLPARAMQTDGKRSA